MKLLKPKRPSQQRSRARRAAPSSSLALVLALNAVVASGCVAQGEKLTRTITPAAIEETLRALNDPENQELLNRLIALPEIQEAARKLSEQITIGVLDALTDEERAERLAQVSDQYVRTLAKAIGESLETEVNPRVRRMLADAVQETLDAALSDKVRRDARALVTTLTRATVTTMTSTLASGLRNDLGPAMQDVLEDNIGPAVHKMLAEDIGPALRQVIREDLAPALKESLEEELRPAVRDLSQEVAHGVVLGVDAGLRDLGQKREPTVVTSVLDRVSGAVDKGIKYSEILAWVLALVVLLLALWLTRTLISRARERDRRSQFERGLLHLMEIIKSTEDRPWSRELVQMLKSKRGHEDARIVEEMLHSKRGGKLRLSSRETDDRAP